MESENYSILENSRYPIEFLELLDNFKKKNDFNVFSDYLSDIVFGVKKPGEAFDIIYDIMSKYTGETELKYNFLSSQNFIMWSSNFVCYIQLFREMGKIKCTINYFGNRDLLNKIKKEMDNYIQRGLNIEWFYLARGQLEYASYSINDYNEAFNASYPFLKDNLEDYYEEFHKSNNNCLILIGEPGTGKTTFITNFIAKYNYNAMVVSDEQIFQTDEIFNTFLTSDRNLMIIEDADLLLLDRKENDNKIMARLLNSTDGLIKIYDKKIIFSANITDLNDIDSAIVRPGRCFDIVKFRKLSKSEAQNVAEEANIKLFDLEKEEYTLAEVFNNRESQYEEKEFGFV